MKIGLVDIFYVKLDKHQMNKIWLKLIYIYIKTDSKSGAN